MAAVRDGALRRPPERRLADAGLTLKQERGGRHRGHGVAGALLRELEQRTRESGAAVFAFHTSRFMTTARAIYERMGYQRVPGFDRELNVHYGAPSGARPWLALAYLKIVDESHPAACAA